MEKPRIIRGDLAVDDRGSVRFVNDFNLAGVKRFYQVENHKTGFIRAWHGHCKESKYIYVVTGSVMVAAVPLDIIQDVDRGSSSIHKFVLSSLKPQILVIPPGYANGYKTLEDNTIVQFFSDRTLEESLEDDLRFDYNIIDVWQDNFR